MIPFVRRLGLGVAMVALATGVVACGGGGEDNASETVARKAAGGDLTACLVNRTSTQVSLTRGTDDGGGCATGPSLRWSFDGNGRPFSVAAFVQSGYPIARIQQESGAFDFCQSLHKVANGPAQTTGVRLSPYQITSRRLDGERLEIALEPGTSAACD